MGIAAPSALPRIPWARPSFSGNEATYLQRAFASTWVSGGEFVERFERDFAAFAGAANAVAVSNGTAALHLAYLAVGVRPGDEVIMPALTFAGCAAMALACGATPRFVDCDPDTLGLSPDAVRDAMAARSPRAVLATHLFGNVCDMDPLVEMCESAEVRLVEDGAESLGAAYRGSRVGTMGEVGCFSFQAAKTITTGEGGMVITRDGELADRVRMLRNHGFRPGTPYWHDVAGFNDRLTNLQAAIGCAQLERIGDILEQRERIRREYEARLRAIPGIRLPQPPRGGRQALWTQVVVLDPEVFPDGRDAVRTRLDRQGIETRPMFYPVYVLPPYRAFATTCPNAERIAAWSLMLPVHEGLSNEDVERVCQAMSAAAGAS